MPSFGQAVNKLRPCIMDIIQSRCCLFLVTLSRAEKISLRRCPIAPLFRQMHAVPQSRAGLPFSASGSICRAGRRRSIACTVLGESCRSAVGALADAYAQCLFSAKGRSAQEVGG